MDMDAQDRYIDNLLRDLRDIRTSADSALSTLYRLNAASRDRKLMQFIESVSNTSAEFVNELEKGNNDILSELTDMPAFNKIIKAAEKIG